MPRGTRKIFVNESRDWQLFLIWNSMSRSRKIKGFRSVVAKHPGDKGRDVYWVRDVVSVSKSIVHEARARQLIIAAWETICSRRSSSRGNSWWVEWEKGWGGKHQTLWRSSHRNVGRAINEFATTKRRGNWFTPRASVSKFPQRESISLSLSPSLHSAFPVSHIFPTWYCCL